MPMRYAVFLVPLFFILHTAKAQESLSKDISYEYLDKLIAVCKANYPKIKMYEARVAVTEYGIKKAKLSYFDILIFPTSTAPTTIRPPSLPQC
jgi:hypothetical protein